MHKQHEDDPVPGLSESGVIARLRQRFSSADRRLLVGMGDDAAVLRFGDAPASGLKLNSADIVVTCDLAIEGVHFSLRYMSLADVGYKTLAMNLSDLAAMGALPAFAFGCLGLPRGVTAAQVDALLDGVDEAARLGGIALAGGDTVAAPQWVIGFTLLGELRGRPLKRAGARPGDILWHSGKLGLSQVGLHELWAGHVPVADADDLPDSGSDEHVGSTYSPPATAAIRAHCRPVPQLELGRWLQRHELASACLDLSDSLSQCLLLLAEASGVGLALNFATYPFAEELREFALAHVERTGAAGAGCSFRVPARMEPAGRGTSYRSLAEFLLASAEDFQLLFAAPPSATARLLRETPAPLTRLGTVADSAEGCQYRDEAGALHPLTPSGFEHLGRREP